jgi:hypothetical protein
MRENIVLQLGGIRLGAGINKRLPQQRHQLPLHDTVAKRMCSLLATRL